MKEKPILFSAPMVRAILADKKTQTRRIVKPQPGDHPKDNGYMDQIIDRGPYKKDDVLWVRETFAYMDEFVMDYKVDPYYHIGYRADLTCRHIGTDDYLDTTGWNWGNEVIKWKPSIFMPKDACRIFLKIKNVRLERLQDITKADAIAEGINPPKWYYKDLCKIPVKQIASDKLLYFDYQYKNDYGLDYAEQSFRSLWISINGNDSWDDNPFVWVIEFERVDE